MSLACKYGRTRNLADARGKFLTEKGSTVLLYDGFLWAECYNSELCGSDLIGRRPIWRSGRLRSFF